MKDTQKQNLELATLIQSEGLPITSERVCFLADMIEAAGIEPTVARIRAVNRDHGSASSIAPHLKEWKCTRDQQAHLAKSIITDDLLVAAEPLLRQLAALVAMEYQAELERHAQDEAILIDQLEMKDKKRIELERQLEDAHLQLADANKTIASLEEGNLSLNKLNEDARQALKALEQENANLTSAVNVKQERIDNLTAVEEARKAELRQAAEDLRVAQAEIQAQHEANMSLTFEQKAADETISTMRAQLVQFEAAKEEALRFSLQLETKKSENRELKHALKQRDDQIVELKDSVLEQAHAVRASNERLEAVKGEMQVYKTELEWIRLERNKDAGQS